MNLTAGQGETNIGNGGQQWKTKEDWEISRDLEMCMNRDLVYFSFHLSRP